MKKNKKKTLRDVVAQGQSRHIKRLRLFFFQSNAHAQGNGPQNRGVDSMGSDAALQNVGEIRARLQNGKVQKPNDAICEGISPLSYW